VIFHRRVRDFTHSCKDAESLDDVYMVRYPIKNEIDGIRYYIKDGSNRKSIKGEKK